MQLEIITPEKTVLREEVTEVLAPTKTGQIGILPHHANIITQLSEGELIMRNKNQEKIFAVTGGFLQVHKNTITVVADYAAHAEEIDVEKAIAAQKRAEEVLKKGREQVSERDFAIASADLRKSILELNVANRRKRRNV